jgi:8-oxo-dGTP pyrophosphatase MutT (NUDIX family)
MFESCPGYHKIMIIKKVQSAGGLVFKDGLVLLITSKSRNSTAIPKGKVEPHELIEETAIREVREETGYDTKIVSKIDSINFDFEKHGEMINKTVTFFKLELVNNLEPKPRLEEAEDLETIWLTPNEAISLLTYDDEKEVLKKATVQG